MEIATVVSKRSKFRMNTIRVLVADDHQLYRAGIKALLDQEPDIAITLEASDGNAILQKLAQSPVDIVLMDIDMPGMNGIEATRLVKEQYPDIRILILSMYDDLDFILKVLKAGASGYLLKEAENLDLASAIKALAIGSSYYSEKISTKLCNYLTEVSPSPSPLPTDLPQLTKRELEILQLIAEEFTNTEIAERLFISDNTVYTHRKNLLSKLNVRNTAGLIRSASQLGLLTD